MRFISSFSILALGIMIMVFIGQCYGNLNQGYYKAKCGQYDVEQIISDVVKQYFLSNPSTVSHLVRLQFHDCIVRGCDASVLLDGKDTEKTAAPNLSLGGYDVIDAAKVAVEKVCPGVVSCADILIMATRSAIFMAGGKWYEVETGRKDGLVSLQAEALTDLPPANIPVHNAIHIFTQKGLTKEDFVILLGGHTVGTTHCDKFKNRLYNFQNTNKADARMNPSLVEELKQTCPISNQVNNQTFLDHTPNSHFRIDNGYYKQILANKGVLEIDTNLAYSPLTNGIARKLANTQDYFLDNFGPAMVKMGRIDVLTGNEGEIRKFCRVVNH